MKYTQEDYEAFYFMHRLYPYLEEKEDFGDTMMRINGWRKPGLFIDITSAKIRRVRAKDTDKLLQLIKESLEAHAAQYLKSAPSFRQENVQYLGNVFHLKKEEVDMLSFAVAVSYNSLLRRILNNLSGDFMRKPRALEMAAGLPEGGGLMFLKSMAPLRRLGIFAKERFGPDMELTIWTQSFVNTVYKNNQARNDFLFGKPLALDELLTYKDFGYIEAAEMAMRLIKQAKHTKGFNILLYGEPGTGKTSFAKLLAKAGKLHLYPVGTEQQGDDDRNYRLQKLYRTQFLFANTKDSGLLFDEAEDLFSSMQTRTNKVEINQLLEKNARPVIWTTNNIAQMDPAYIRRFTLAVCFTKPPIEVRQKIWKKYLHENHIACSAAERINLAKTYEVPPSMIESAARVAKMAHGDLAAVKAHLGFMKQALCGGYKQAEEKQNTQGFSPQLIHADLDLQALTDQIKQLKRLDFSLCLYGASGTGKSAYARYLAEQLGLDVIHYRASDLMSMYVGGTEKRIAQAFARAKESKAMLVFDEADTFLRDRSLAAHSWEVSSVNEMLTWMESHPYPFICTTNLMNTLDPASLRRFSFKVKYDFLTGYQVQQAFAYFFGLKVSAKEVEHLTKLTPGDFTVVKNKATFLGKSTNIGALCEMLLGEQQLKQGGNSQGIGFHL